MQFLITDGETFFHEERRDLDNEIECIEPNALGYRVTTSDRKGRYRLVKQIISDPHQPCVLIHAQVEGEQVRKVVVELRAALEAEHVVLGGGNAKKLKKLPPSSVLGDNQNAFVGGFRIWSEDGSSQN
jgi:glucoamylase